jgi:hypothetical protein
VSPAELAELVLDRREWVDGFVEELVELGRGNAAELVEARLECSNEGNPALRVLLAAEGLHMAASGAMDPIPEDDLRVLLGVLKWRLRIWTPGRETSAAFDDAVRAIRSASLAEYGVTP